VAALATLDDLEARLGSRVTDEDRAEALLDDVSAIVRAYTGQQFTLVEDDEIRVRVRNGSLRLPQRPVVDVTAVANVDGDSVDFTWDSGDSVQLEGFAALRTSFEVEPFRHRDPWVNVTYSHGYETVPADIVAVVCQIAARAYGRTPDTTGVTQESIAGYSYSVGAAAAAGPAGMLADERRILDQYRRPLSVIRVGL
jgi:hypothetical protein